jgi:2'-5' RNA ligase
MNPGAVVFLALRVPEAVAEGLCADVIETFGDTSAEYRWPRADGLHVTLFYLGPVERGRLGTLAQCVRSAVKGLSAPTLCLAEAGSFQKRGRERVLWIGATEPEEKNGALAALHGAVVEGVSEFGADTREERVRPYAPHITIARPRYPKPRVPEAFYALQSEGCWRAAKLELIESTRGSGPAVYATLEAFPLAD